MSAPSALRFHKVSAGRYATEGNVWAVERDTTGYVPVAQRDGGGVLAGCADDGWCAMLRGEVLDWFDTKREAVAFCQSSANSRGLINTPSTATERHTP